MGQLVDVSDGWRSPAVFAFQGESLRYLTIFAACAVVITSIAVDRRGVYAAQGDVVLYPADISVVSGTWLRASSTTAAGGLKMTTADAGWATTDAPLAAPANYFEWNFTADASTTFQLWLRLRAAADSKWNDSVWVQFSDAVASDGSPLWRIGTSSALLVNLEDCIGCGVAGWGWQDNGSWTGQSARLRFASSGSHTARVQVREDGVDVDQMVLSPLQWLSNPPGAVRNDATIVPKPSASPSLTMVREPYLQQVTASSAIVVWATRENGTAEVHYGAAGSAMSAIAPATTRLVRASITGMAFDYYQHEATIGNLNASTLYGYQAVVAGLPAGISSSLTTAPPTGTGSVGFIAFGDSGFGSAAQSQLASLMNGELFDFALHTGDIVYAVNGGLSGSYLQYHSWFFDVYKTWLRSHAVFPSIGNHDDESSHAAPYRDLFVLPNNGASPVFADHTERYYSFDYGPAHVVVLDTELALQDPVRRREQVIWLADDLARTSQPWKIAAFHRPAFNAGSEHGSDPLVQAEFVPIFETYGVSIVLNGHEHDYERTVPWRQTMNGSFVTYVVTGGGGVPLYPAGTGPWTAVSRSVHHYVRGRVSPCTLTVEAVGLDAKVFDSLRLDRCTAAPTPYGGVAAAVPGLIQAENFDAGPAGAAYSDSTAGNSGGSYRASDVDIQPTADVGGGYNVGWMDAGEWLAYTVDVARAGDYAISVRVAANGPGGTFHIESNGATIAGPAMVPNTGNWQVWQTIVLQPVRLAAGRQTLRVAIDSLGSTGIFGNLNSFTLTEVSADVQSTPYRGVAVSLPGVIQAEDFDEGGSGVGYHDTSPGNSGASYREGDVDLQPTADAGGGYNVGWMAPGEWANYSVAVTAAGSYTVECRVAAAGPGGTFHLESNGIPLTGAVTVPDTGSWQSWTSVTVSGLQLAAGAQRIRLIVDTTGVTGVFGNVNYLRFTRSP